MAARNDLGLELPDALQDLVELVLVHQSEPGMVATVEEVEALGEGRFRYVGHVLTKIRYEGAKGIGAKEDARLGIVERNSGGGIEEGWAQDGQLAVAGAEALAGIEELHPLHRYVIRRI